MRLFTNRQDFYNDISEEIRLFIASEEIVLTDDISDSDLTVILDVKNDCFCADAFYLTEQRSFYYAYKSEYDGSSVLVEKRLAKRAIKIAVFRCLKSAYPSANLPWGSLTGIRPTRLWRELVSLNGLSQARSIMLDSFDVSTEKLQLADEIVSYQLPILSSIAPNDVDIYVGIPFCKTRCLYCSFASQLRTPKTDMSAYLQALKRDISLGAQMVSDKGLNVRAVYMGGGTPTILTAAELEELILHVKKEYAVKSGTEFTVEAGRPDTITEEKLRLIRDLGITRISINPQTMCDATLKAVGRDHSCNDIIDCFHMARGLGFDCINMDLIAGLPGENVDSMLNSVSQLAKLDPDCLTVHTLAIKRSSVLHEHLGSFTLPDVREVDKMTKVAADAARNMGMIPYYMYRQKYMAGNLENVGYSSPDKICVYNIDMMEDVLSIIAHGAGAMSKRVFNEGGRIERVPNPKDISTYIAKIDKINSERVNVWNI